MHDAQVPSRRTFLASTAVAAAAVGGGLPLLTGCSTAGETGRKEGTTTGRDLRALLPTFVPGKGGPQPDVPSENGSRPGYVTAPPADQLATSVPEKLGRGGEITVMSPLWGTPPKGDCAYYTAMSEAIGTRVTWQNQDGNFYGEKLGAVLAGSGVPDVVVVPGWEMQGQIPSAVVNKFADLGPYLSGDRVREYPNLAAIPTSAWQRSIFGGALRGLPMPGGQVPNIGVFYRKDRFEAAGWQPPTSAAEFADLAREITAPKSEVWACGDMKWAAFKFFGVLEDKPCCWREENGRLVHRFETEEYLEALEWTRKLFASGVVHPDARAGLPNANNRFTAGQLLIYNADTSDWYGKTSEQHAQNPDFAMALMDYFHHDGGDPRLYRNVPANIWSFVNRKASEETIREVLAVANFTAAPYGSTEQRLRAYGVEGVNHTLEDGVPVKTDQGNAEVVGSFEYLASPAPFLAYPDLPEVVRGWASWEQRMGAFTTEPLFYGMQIIEPQRFAKLSNPFEDLEDDVTRGRKKIGDMQQAVSDWRRRGGDKLRDWYQKLLDESGGSAD